MAIEQLNLPNISMYIQKIQIEIKSKTDKDEIFEDEFAQQLFRLQGMEIKSSSDFSII
jgi:hypothetical protein